MFTRIATPVESEESGEEDVIKFDIDDLHSETSNPADSAQASSDKTLQEEVRKLQNEVSRLHKSECCVIKHFPAVTVAVGCLVT